MTCKKCGPSELYRGILCVHCKVDANQATIIRRNMYGAAKYAGASFARLAGGSGKPLAALVLAQKKSMGTFSKQQCAVLAQDIRRAHSAILPSVGGTARERVACELQGIASRAADAARGGAPLKAGELLFVTNVRNGKAGESQDNDNASNDGAENRLEAKTDNDAAQRAAMKAMINRPQYFCVEVLLGDVALLLDVEIDTNMKLGSEFRFAKQRYHATLSSSKPPQPAWKIAPLAVGVHANHERCAACKAIGSSKVLQRFDDAFAQASVKVEESENARLRRELEELEQAVPRG